MSTPKLKTGQARISMLPVSSLKPSPENERLYKPVRPDEPEIVALAAGVRSNGVRQPLEVTADRFITSGHRRHAAAMLAGLAEVPCLVLGRRRDEFDAGEYVALLRENNRSRDKTIAERMREAMVDADPARSHAALLDERRRQRQQLIDGQAVELGAYRGRAEISAGKRPMLAAAAAVIDGWRATWPVSVRRVHYGLLNDPPCRFVSAAGSGKNPYRNDAHRYDDLCDLLCRARIAPGRFRCRRSTTRRGR